LKEYLKKENKRLAWLDFGKSIGIIVVLTVHAGCSLGPVTFYGGMFYMPIFFVAAGYTYHCRKEEPYRSFLKKKAKRLLLPYFGTSIFLWLFFWIKDSVLSGNITDFKLDSIFGVFYSRNQMFLASYKGENPGILTLLNAPLWFLTAIFLVYAYYEILNRSKQKEKWLMIGFVCSMIWHYNTKLLLPWSIEAVPYFSCFFAAGEWMREKQIVNVLKEKKNLWIVIALLIVFLALPRWNGSVNLSIGEYGRSMLVYLLIGILGSLLTFLVGAYLEQICEPLVHALTLVGQETLIILCFHMFLYMFMETASKILKLNKGITQAIMILVSALILTGIGKKFCQNKH